MVALPENHQDVTEAAVDVASSHSRPPATMNADTVRVVKKSGFKRKACPYVVTLVALFIAYVCVQVRGPSISIAWPSTVRSDGDIQRGT
jgi:hypothetical protein